MLGIADVPAALSPHPVFVGRDVDRALAATSAVVNPHTVDVLGDPRKIDVRLHAAKVGAVTLLHLGWGADVEITALGEANCFCIQLPMRGEARIDCGDQSIVSSPTRPSVPSPGEPLRMRWESGSTQLILRIDKRTVEERLQRFIDAPLHRGPIRMPLGIDLRGAAGARWRAMFELVEAEIAVRDQFSTMGMTSAVTVEELVINALLLWHPNNYSAQLSHDILPARAPYVRQAMGYVREHLGTPLTVPELADHVGVSVRALQAGFARDLGCTPSAYIRDQRLDRIREELLRSDPFEGTSVTDVALRWGFSHLGRMSQAYRTRFGELPSQTLRGSGHRTVPDPRAHRAG
ncbi:AraC family transcriptional regulator [Streptomyces sp. 6N223]|uniref:AraC family transcriptional regulator n=1 Tax=Streptomyces sp. 6N223 TaxID=3457412 RepID=UPI003FD642D7